jgi:hypothetical protein
VYVPAEETVIELPLSPSLHRSPVEADEVSTTLLPVQIETVSPGVIAGAGGIGLTVTTAGMDGVLTQPLAVSVTVYDPDV